MTMKNPPHPGLSVRRDCIEPLGLTITEAAQASGVTRQTLNNLVTGKSGISADVAIRLDKAFGGDAETWLRLQMAYDLAQARQHEADINVKPVSRRKLHETAPVTADGRLDLTSQYARLTRHHLLVNLVNSCEVPQGRDR